VGLAANHTTIAAGISTKSDFTPPNSAINPNRMRTAAQLIDFFEFMLIVKSLR
jgi:hypothetical protein